MAGQCLLLIIDYSATFLERNESEPSGPLTVWELHNYIVRQLSEPLKVVPRVSTRK
jgi:hypothetical protein